MSLEEQLNTLKAHLATAEQEMSSLKAGRKSAAPRLRKSLMAIKTGSHGMRAGTTAYVRDLPTKSRKKVEEPPEPTPEPTRVKRAPKKKLRSQPEAENDPENS
jgi:hypothetical protein